MTRRDRMHWLKSALLLALGLFFACAAQFPFMAFWFSVLGGFATHMLTQKPRKRRR